MKRAGIDPIIDEDVIIACLTQTESETQHGSGALMALIDAWDRDITRDQFVALASAVVTCCDNIGRHSMIHAVKMFLKKNDYDIAPADVEITIKTTGDMLKISTGDVRKMARLMAQMAKAEDAVH
jgi:hypothetical protein